MKKFFLLSFLFFLGISYGQRLFVEEFNYAAGDALTGHNWLLSGTSSTNPVSAVAPGLTFPNYPSVIGNACYMENNGQDVYQTYAAVNSGSIYLSFLLNVQAAQTGDYFIALSPTNFVSSSGVVSSGQTNYYTRTFIKASGTTGFQIGLQKYTEAGTYSTKVLNLNTTYLVVVKYAFNAATTADDAVSLFVFSASAPTTEPTTPDVGPTAGDAAKLDATDLSFVTLRQGSSSSAAQLKIDGIRIAKSWATVTDVEKNASTIPTKYELNQNYPNPFNPSTVINYQLPEAGNVSLKVYDVLGNEVATLVNEFKQAGVYNAKFANANLSSGIYLYRLQAGSFVSVKRMMLIK